MDVQVRHVNTFSLCTGHSFLSIPNVLCLIIMITKFITDFRESYLRFCSQIFSLTNIHESVHLSNNAVQCKYTNGKRDKNLPDENMWDCYTFQTYLR